MCESPGSLTLSASRKGLNVRIGVSGRSDLKVDDMEENRELGLRKTEEMEFDMVKTRLIRSVLHRRACNHRACISELEPIPRRASGRSRNSYDKHALQVL